MKRFANWLYRLTHEREINIVTQRLKDAIYKESNLFSKSTRAKNDAEKLELLGEARAVNGQCIGLSEALLELKVNKPVRK